MKRQQIGTFRLKVGPEWGEGKPAILFNGWIGIGKSKQDNGQHGAELHLRVKLDPDPRYVFQFEDETKLSPQIVQLQGTIKQPIFSCKFSQDRQGSVLRLPTGASYAPFDPTRVTQISWRPRAFIYKGFLTDAECDHLIHLAKDKLEKSMVADNESGKSIASEVRTSSGMFLKKAQVKVTGRRWDQPLQTFCHKIPVILCEGHGVTGCLGIRAQILQRITSSKLVRIKHAWGILEIPKVSWLEANPLLALHKLALPNTLQYLVNLHVTSQGCCVGSNHMEKLIRLKLSKLEAYFLSLVSLFKDEVVARIESRLASWTFLPEENGEAMQILHYEHGQKYEPHFDYFHDKANQELGGHRVATVLMYLSDVKRGGETIFPNSEAKDTQPKEDNWSDCAKNGYAVKPNKGDALLFFSLHLDATTDPLSLHGSCPVIEGEKWSATKWIHVRSFDKTAKPENEDCIDDNVHCVQWAANGECKRNPVYMVGSNDSLGYCRKSCKIVYIVTLLSFNPRRARKRAKYLYMGYLVNPSGDVIGIVFEAVRALQAGFGTTIFSYTSRSPVGSMHEPWPSRKSNKWISKIRVSPIINHPPSGSENRVRVSAPSPPSKSKSKSPKCTFSAIFRRCVGSSA
ncbi:oxoglutarate/iron-dependent oxygenase [Actinidia rufa]|uniref:procollagen-proline 4-dioxygenase n=1 Tax=Actinidia rufa TaxID=165716 RepID=A0A7J0DCC9_9ERIC|nr:oxoglutarate/iron-dependent oxygenase [Actinidia rufa]